MVVLNGDEDLWWAGATNLGIKYVLENIKDSDFILTLNNDVEVRWVYVE